MTILAMPKAAAAARDPIIVVSKELYRRLVAPSNLPLKRPKRMSARTVMPMLMYKAVNALGSKKYGKICEGIQEKE